MIDMKACIKQWMEQDTLSPGLEAVLLALEEECYLSPDKADAPWETLMRDIAAVNRRMLRRWQASQQAGA